MSSFTKTLPENYEGNYNDWYFVWHPPKVDAMTQARRWQDVQMVTVMVPDPTVRRGTGHPEPAAKLGGYARQNSEGLNWCWMPMADFAKLMAEPVREADPGAALLESAKRDAAIVTHLLAMRTAMDEVMEIFHNGAKP